MAPPAEAAGRGGGEDVRRPAATSCVPGMEETESVPQGSEIIQGKVTFL